MSDKRQNDIIIHMKAVLSSKLSLSDYQLFALHKFLGKDSLRDVKILFVFDAVGDNKDNLPEWTYRDVKKLRSLGAKVILYSLSKDGNDQKILESDILFFEGGSTPRLLQAIKKSQIMDIINSDLCDNKIWFGISAGGCVLSKKCYSSCEKWFIENPEEEPADGLCKDGDFVFIPHFKSKDFPKNTEDNLKFVKEKLNGLTAIIGTDSCMVTGIIKNNLFIPAKKAHEFIFIE